MLVLGSVFLTGDFVVSTFCGWFYLVQLGGWKVYFSSSRIHCHLDQSDLTRPKNPPNGGLVGEMGPLISEKSRLVKYCNLARAKA